MIRDVIKKTNLHIQRLDSIEYEIESMLINEIDFENLEHIKTEDMFVYRFIRLQDYLGNKFFKTFLNVIGEYGENMPFIDVLDTLEKFGFLNADEWLEIRQIRNKISHEYPDCENEIIEDIELALKKYGVMKNVFFNMVGYLKNKNIIKEEDVF